MSISMVDSMTLVEGGMEVFVLHGALSLKFDASPWYRQHVARCQHTKAVDFLVRTKPDDPDGARVIWIELKDYRGYLDEEAEAIPQLREELACKFRDTAAALFAARFRTLPECSALHPYIPDEEGALQLVFCWGSDLQADREGKRRRSRLRDWLSSSLGWLSQDIQVLAPGDVRFGLSISAGSTP